MQYNNKAVGLVKTEIFTEYQNQIAKYAKVLGHPARIAILQHLFKTKSCICGNLVDVIGLAQATISQHLKELKNLGIIQGSIDGTKVCYCIDQENWRQMKTVVETFLGQSSDNSEGCC